MSCAWRQRRSCCGTWLSSLVGIQVPAQLFAVCWLPWYPLIATCLASIHNMMAEPVHISLPDPFGCMPSLAVLVKSFHVVHACEVLPLSLEQPLPHSAARPLQGCQRCQLWPVWRVS